MKNIFVIILLMTYALSCKASNKKPIANEDSLAIKTVQEFYDWYINEAYPKSTSYYQVPGYKKLDKFTYIFDLEEYEERLNTIKYFSENYKQKLINKLQNCNQEMQKIKWEYEPEPMFNIEACNYLWGNQWIGGQGERVDGFKVESIKIKNGEAECVVNILINNRSFVQSIVLLEKARNEYKISNIDLNWEKD